MLFKYYLKYFNMLKRVKSNNIYWAAVESVEKPIIEAALERTFGNKLKAAKILGINRNTLNAKIKKLGIRVDKYKI